MSDDGTGSGAKDLVHTAEPVERDAGAGRIAHLEANRGLIIRRSLLATVVGGAIPLPVMDDYVAGRVRAGMLMKVAERRRVDLVQSSAELLGDPREGTALRNATLTAATVLAVKLAWRKFFAVLAVGRRAEEMATSFQTGSLFDHYCARLHVGAGIDRPRAFRLRGAIHASVSQVEKEALVGVFRDGGRVLGQSLGEAPGWISERVGKLAERWVRTGGNPSPEVDAALEAEASGEDSRWLDRAARAVEQSLAGLGQSYLGGLVDDFEKRWRVLEAEAAKAASPPTPPTPTTPPTPAPATGGTP